MLLAIIQVESAARWKTLCSPRISGASPNSLSTEESIKQGCKYFRNCFGSGRKQRLRLSQRGSVLQLRRRFPRLCGRTRKKIHLELAESFCEGQTGERVTYTNPAAVEKNGGWRYSYGNMFYVLLVSQIPDRGTVSDDETVQLRE